MVSLGDAILFSAYSGLSTVLGTLIIFFFRVTHKMLAFSLGISSGVMTFISLFILSPLASLKGGFVHLAFGFALALVFILILHRLPFVKRKDEGTSSLVRLGFFLVIAIAIHNAPEGMAMGIGFQMAHHVGIALTIAMAIHNIPEGIGLAAPLLVAKRSPLIIIMLSLICAAILPLGTWIGLTLLNETPEIVATILFFAATTMIWVAINEVCPRGLSLNKKSTIYGVLTGCFFMYILHLIH